MATGLVPYNSPQKVLVQPTQDEKADTPTPQRPAPAPSPGASPGQLSSEEVDPAATPSRGSISLRDAMETADERLVTPSKQSDVGRSLATAAASSRATSLPPLAAAKPKGVPCTWWQCPECDFLIQHSSTDQLGNMSKYSHMKTKHIEQAHPEAEHLKVAKRGLRDTAAVSAKIVATRMAEVLRQANEYKGTHHLTADTYRVICDKCDYHGFFKDLPPTGSKRRRQEESNIGTARGGGKRPYRKTFAPASEAEDTAATQRGVGATARCTPAATSSALATPAGGAEAAPLPPSATRRPVEGLGLHQAPASAGIHGRSDCESVRSSGSSESAAVTPRSPSPSVSGPWGSPNSGHISSLDVHLARADPLRDARLEPYYALMRQGDRPDYMYTEYGVPRCLDDLPLGFRRPPTEQLGTPGQAAHTAIVGDAGDTPFLAGSSPSSPIAVIVIESDDDMPHAGAAPANDDTTLGLRVPPPAAAPTSADTAPARDAAATFRGGHREHRNKFNRITTVGNGMCLWQSFAALVGASPYAIRDRTVSMLKSMAGELHQGRSFRDTALLEFGNEWPDYLRSIRDGTTWPGVLEIMAASRLLKHEVVIYSSDDGDYKWMHSTADYLKEKQEECVGTLHLDYQLGSHYEALEPRPLTPPVPPEVTRDLGHHVSHLLYANISSFDLHAPSIFKLAAEHQVRAIALAETRISYSTAGAAAMAREAGFGTPLFSAPVPNKTGTTAPREGGLAFMQSGLPAVSGDYLTHLPEQHAVHAILRLFGAQSPRLHVVVLYTKDEEVRDTIIAAAEVLHTEPCIIIGDWNCTPGEVHGNHRRFSPAVEAALATHLWHDIQGGTQPTTHSVGRLGHRVDFALINNAARHVVVGIQTLTCSPMVNHFPLLVTIRSCNAVPLMRTLDLTADYKKLAEFKDAGDRIAEEFDHEAYAMRDAIADGRVDDAWHLWTTSSEQAVRTVAKQFSLSVPRQRDKGAPPSSTWRPAWSQKVTKSDYKLHHAFTKLQALRCMLKHPGPCNTLELAALASQVRRLIQSYYAQQVSFTEPSIDEYVRNFSEAIQNQRKRTAQEAIAKWRERVTTSFAAACRWVKGVSQPLAGFPSDLADHVFEACEEKFTQSHVADEAERLLQDAGHLAIFTAYSWPQLEWAELKYFTCRKANASNGLDGWASSELALLPPSAWALLTCILQLVELHGEWPRDLCYAYHAALRKDGQPDTMGRPPLRLLLVLPQIMRGWGTLRSRHIVVWMKGFMDQALHGGFAGHSTMTANIPLIYRTAKATQDGHDLVGSSLDYKECFDRIDVRTALAVLLAWGLDPGIARAITGMYARIRRMVIVAGCCKGYFAATVGIIQGCALSIYLLAGLMDLWVKRTKYKLALNLSVDNDVTFSVYLDDRNILTTSPATLDYVLRCTGEFDDLITAILNAGKCQLYGTSWEVIEAMALLCPGAKVCSRPWSLGCVLTTGMDADQQDKVKLEKRYLKALAVAKRAAALPHDCRSRVMTAMFGPSYAFGIELEPPSDVQSRALEAAYKRTMLSGRPAASRYITLAVLYKGHLASPLAQRLFAGVRLLRLAAQHGMSTDTDVYMRDPSPHSPFAYLSDALRQVGAAWAGRGRILYRPFADLVQFSIYGEAGLVSHELRELWRHSLRRQAKPRMDMQGSELGIDGDTTRRIFGNKELTPWQRGCLRSILVGTTWTPSRFFRASLITEAQAICSRCTAGEIDSIGHRYQCNAMQHLLPQSLRDLDLDTLPRCLTRCGLAPCVPLEGLGKQAWQRLVLDFQTFLLNSTIEADTYAHMQNLYQQAFGTKASPHNGL